MNVESSPFWIFVSASRRVNRHFFATLMMAIMLGVLGGCSSSPDRDQADDDEATSTGDVAPDLRVSLDEMCKLHGFVYRSFGDGRFSASRGSASVELRSGSRVANFGGDTVVLDVAPEIRGADLMLSNDAANRIDDWIDGRSQPALKPVRQPDPVTPRAPAEPKGTIKGATIVLDPGHGGKDPGTSSKAGVREKNVVLVVSLEVERLLKAAGARVVMTRRDDTFIELEDRAPFSNRQKPTAFVSIHADAAPNKDARGVEIFYAIKHSTAPSAAVLARSKRLADAIYAKISAVTPTADRGTKPNTNRFQVVKNNDYPAVLVEIGFMSNAAEAKLLAQRDYQMKMARGIADGIIDFVTKN